MQRLVDLLYNEVKQVSVDLLGQRVPGIDGLRPGHGLHHSFRGGHNFSVAEPLGHFAGLQAQELTEHLQVTVILLEETDTGLEIEIKPGVEQEAVVTLSLLQ